MAKGVAVKRAAIKIDDQLRAGPNASVDVGGGKAGQDTRVIDMGKRVTPETWAEAEAEKMVPALIVSSTRKRDKVDAAKSE